MSELSKPMLPKSARKPELCPPALYVQHCRERAAAYKQYCSPYERRVSGFGLFRGGKLGYAYRSLLIAADAAFLVLFALF